MEKLSLNQSREIQGRNYPEDNYKTKIMSKFEFYDTHVSNFLNSINNYLLHRH